MKEILQCKSCGEHLEPSKIEEHVREMHFWA
jgi:hypothetical protein